MYSWKSHVEFFFFWKNKREAEKLAQWVMCILPKHEDLCLENPRETRLGSVDLYLSVTLQRWEVETGESLEIWQGPAR